MNITQINLGIEIVGTILGLIYVYYQYKASPKLWWACLVSAVPMIYLNFYKGNLATGLLYTYYFIMAVKMLTTSSKEEQESEVLQIESVPARLYPRIIAGIAILLAVFLGAHYTGFFGLMAAMGIAQHDSSLLNTLADCGATTLCFLGMWLLSKKYLEQWYMWIVANVLFLYLFAGTGMYFLAGMMVFYILTSIIGLINWKRLRRAQTKEA